MPALDDLVRPSEIQRKHLVPEVDALCPGFEPPLDRRVLRDHQVSQIYTGLVLGEVEADDRPLGVPTIRA
jgi:hypothetical protein